MQNERYFVGMKPCIPLRSQSKNETICVWSIHRG